MGSDQPTTTTVTATPPDARVPDQPRGEHRTAPVGSDTLHDALTNLFRAITAGVR